ncbi:MAG: ABC transporter permease [Roseburia sp.]|nr:ABC transporter permease [Roseburia sp.]
MKDFVRSTLAFTARNLKVFFKDKGAVISALIAPLVILLLYILFLHNVLKSTFTVSLGDISLDKALVNGYVAAFEVSSILAVCGVTVAFVVNMTMVDDRITGVRADLDVSPVNRNALTLGYFFSTAIATLAICYITLAVGFVYVGVMGWRIPVGSGFAIVLDVFLVSLFGTALSSIVAYFLKSRGAINAVSTIVSTVYGFICGAYYPISQFSSGMSNTVMCLPGTYFTSLLRSHFMSGYYAPFVNAGIPETAAKEILDSLDANVYFFGSSVPTWAMYIVAVCSVAVLLGAFILLNVFGGRKKRAKTSSTADAARSDAGE